MSGNRLVWLLGLVLIAVGNSAWQAAPSPKPPPVKEQAAPPPPRAEDVYNNIQVLKGQPATDVLPTMLQMRHLLGVECEYCHTPHDWPNDSKPTKLRTREMFQMLGFVIRSGGDPNFKMSCWACHRGQTTPAAFKPDDDMVKRVASLITIPAGAEDKPAEQVFKNIQLLQGVPARRLPVIMTLFSTSLGVTCSHCHASGGAWEKDDKPQKQRARQMLTMVRATWQKFYTGNDNAPVSCFTCHHGAVKPELQDSSANAAVSGQ